MFKVQRFTFLIYFIALITIGSVGFYLIGGDEWSFIDSMYMTILTLSTVGFGEVHPLSEIGKLWAILLIIFGVSGFAYIVYELGSELIQLNTYRSHTMRKKISKLQSHYVICGYGRMGAIIASEFQKKNISFVIIEINDSKIIDIQENGYNHIHGDATLDETLINAGIIDSKGIVVVLDNDQDNLFVTMSARNLNQDSYIISRCSKQDTGNKLKRAGANKVVNPYITGGHRMAELLISPNIDDIVTIESPDNISVDFSIEEVSVKNFNILNNKTINELNIREKYNLAIVAIINKDRSKQLNPGPDV
ncbi:NAD-binding protein, partial [Candidatus Marinimicrobia bacterium]|nr:NAD-binding protein [Candidatus Neomarinimicrobiota bacterium]